MTVGIVGRNAGVPCSGPTSYPPGRGKSPRNYWKSRCRPAAMKITIPKIITTDLYCSVGRDFAALLQDPRAPARREAALDRTRP